MNGTSDASPWTSRKLWRVAIGVFLAQCVLILLLSDRASTSPRAAAQGAFFRFVAKAVTDEEILTGIFASDPTMFVLPDRNGFSGMAWLKLKDSAYSPPEWDEPPRWLGFDTDSLGKAVLLEARSSRLPEINTFADPIADGSDLPLPPRQQVSSSFRVEGELRQRFVHARRAPSSWPRSEVLGETVVQAAINGAGDVVTCRLLPPGSGWRQADEEALETVRTARFEPRNDSPQLAWGTFVFQWQTVPLAETNDVNAASEIP